MLHYDDALKKLLDGNRRFAREAMTHPHMSKDRIKDLSAAQKPFAVILTCSDSRVAPEVIFDCGLGDIFTIRLAGGIPSEEAIGSIEYAVNKLGANLVLVLGHDSCGAVGAALSGNNFSKNIDKICGYVTEHFSEESRSEINPNEASKVVSMKIAEQLSNEKELKSKVDNNQIKILPAHYSFLSGEVEVL